MSMTWFYDLPQEERDELETEVYAPIYDAVIEAICRFQGGDTPPREAMEIAEAAACTAMFRVKFPFQP